MNNSDLKKFNDLSERVKKLETAKKRQEIEGEAVSLNWTIASIDWWECLTAEQLVEVSKCLQKANKIWLDKAGISVQFVEYKYLTGS